MRIAIFLAALVICSNALAHVHKDETSSKSFKQAVFIVSPLDGATVSKEFKVVFGITGMTVSPAGIEKANSGHHHLLIDGKKLPDLSKPLGGDVRHFGAGQTETILVLEPGEHSLQLILADHMHLPHQPPVVSKKITITVK
jgi:hypothetical protein